jgi:GDPmannose 4,6-dehydratase
LAAMSHVGVSFDQPITTCQIDALGPLYILEAIRQSSPQSKFYQASSSELFGDTTTSPQNEDTPFNPNSPYAVAKLYAHHLTTLYRRAYGIFACAGILYNHESERRGQDFVTRKITKYVAMLQFWMDNHSGFPCKDVDVRPLALGNIGAIRDWSHAEDMVYGMWLMMQQSEPDDFVLGSGESRSVKDFLNSAFGSIGLDYSDYVVIDPKFYRPADVNLLHADCSKAKAILGWEPTVGFGELVDRMVQGDYRKLLEKGVVV